MKHVKHEALVYIIFVMVAAYHKHCYIFGINAHTVQTMQTQRQCCKVRVHKGGFHVFTKSYYISLF